MDLGGTLESLRAGIIPTLRQRKWSFFKKLARLGFTAFDAC